MATFSVFMTDNNAKIGIMKSGAKEVEYVGSITEVLEKMKDGVGAIVIEVGQDNMFLGGKPVKIIVGADGSVNIVGIFTDDIEEENVTVRVDKLKDDEQYIDAVDISKYDELYIEVDDISKPMVYRRVNENEFDVYMVKDDEYKFIVRMDVETLERTLNKRDLRIINKNMKFGKKYDIVENGKKLEIRYLG